MANKNKEETKAAVQNDETEALQLEISMLKVQLQSLYNLIESAKVDLVGVEELEKLLPERKEAILGLVLQEIDLRKKTSLLLSEKEELEKSILENSEKIEQAELMAIKTQKSNQLVWENEIAELSKLKDHLIFDTENLADGVRALEKEVQDQETAKIAINNTMELVVKQSADLVQANVAQEAAIVAKKQELSQYTFSLENLLKEAERAQGVVSGLVAIKKEMEEELGALEQEIGSLKSQKECVLGEYRAGKDGIEAEIAGRIDELAKRETDLAQKDGELSLRENSVKSTVAKIHLYKASLEKKTGTLTGTLDL